MLPKYSRKQQYHTNDQNGSYYNTGVVKYQTLRILRWQSVTSSLIKRSLDLSLTPPPASSVYKTILLAVFIYNQLQNQEESLVLP
jgi:hypothetical protein